MITAIRLAATHAVSAGVRYHKCMHSRCIRYYPFGPGNRILLAAMQHMEDPSLFFERTRWQQACADIQRKIRDATKRLEDTKNQEWMANQYAMRAESELRRAEQTAATAQTEADAKEIALLSVVRMLECGSASTGTACSSQAVPISPTQRTLRVACLTIAFVTIAFVWRAVIGLVRG